MRTGLPELLAYLRRTTRAPVTPRLADEAAWYTEHTALFISTLKWTILGAGAGACVGFGTRGFLWSLSASAQLVAAHTPRGFAPYWLLPVALPVGVWLIRTFAKEAHGHGTEAVIAAVHQRSGRIDWPVAPIKLGATVLTVTFGGSVGKEGPAAQIGAALTSLFADLLHLSDADRRRLVICGISAGFAAVFGTPISGALFGIEVLYLGVLDYSVIFPAVVAGIVGHLTCGTAPPFPVLPDTLATTGFPTAILVSLGSGALFGLIALLLIESMRSLHVRLRQFQAYPYRIAVIGGIALALLYRVTGDQYSGLGTDTINGILAGTSTVVWSAFLIKILATSITLETGGSGGIVTPIFFIGAASGAATCAPRKARRRACLGRTRSGRGRTRAAAP